MNRILLADDHPMIRTALDVLLRDSDFDIVGMAGSGEEALAAVEEVKPDILLLDLQMPGGGGMSVVFSCGKVGGLRSLAHHATARASPTTPGRMKAMCQFHQPVSNATSGGARMAPTVVQGLS